MIELLWWHWAVLGFGLIMAELVIPAFVVVWFGLGSFFVSLALYLAPEISLTAQVLLWTLSSILMTLLWFRIFKKDFHKSFVGRASAALVGEVGMIAERVEPFKNGKVRFQKPLVGSDLWDCNSDESLDTGARVRVEAVEGNVVTVKKLKG